jgi:segregation and condensation protein B
MVLRPEFESVRANFYGKVRESRLPQPALDTLAIVAYRQPITAEEVQTLRRQPCSAILNQLVRRNLLQTSQEVQNKKSIVRYHTTPRFLEWCQIKSLDDLPRADELDYR